MKNKQGFTLIELLVVVLIIGILTAIAFPQYKKSVAKSEMAGVIQNFKDIRTAMERYYLEHNIWPNDINMLDIEIPSSSDWEYTLIQDTGIENAHWGGQPRAFASIKASRKKLKAVGGVYYSIPSRILSSYNYKPGVFCCLWTDATDKKLKEFCKNASESNSNAGRCYTGTWVSVKNL